MSLGGSAGTKSSAHTIIMTVATTAGMRPYRKDDGGIGRSRGMPACMNIPTGRGATVGVGRISGAIAPAVGAAGRRAAW